MIPAKKLSRVWYCRVPLQSMSFSNVRVRVEYQKESIRLTVLPKWYDPNARCASHSSSLYQVINLRKIPFTYVICDCGARRAAFLS